MLFVARDTIGLFMALQGFLALAAYLLHLCDPSGAIAKLYPEKWAEVDAASHLKIGPYYVTTAVAWIFYFFALTHIRFRKCWLRY